MALASEQGRLLAGRYRRIRRLGAGGMATVFLAEDERLGREVAVKRLHSESPDDVAARFQREAKLGASLNHPNLVAIYDIATDDEGVLIVMEYVDGPTLRQELEHGPMEARRALRVLQDVASALHHAHENGVVHRDVKPANVLLRGDGRTKLTDLGIATAAENTAITRSGTVLGTAAYMPPERLDGRAGDHRVDVYALAAVAFETLTGAKAFTGSTPVEIARRVATQPPPDLGEALPGAPARAADVLKRGLAKDPADRPDSACELIDELEAALEPTATARTRKAPAAPPPPPRAPAPAPRAAAAPAPRPTAPDGPAGAVRTSRARRRPAWLAPVAALALLVAVAAIVFAVTAGDEDGGGERAASSDRAAEGESDSGGGSGEESKPAPEEAPSTGGGQAPAPADPSAPAAGGPADAVQSFYTSAAADDYDASWALATERLRSQLGGRASFESGQGSLERISFPKLKARDETADSATVEFQSIAQHTTKTDRCKGEVSLVRQDGRWLLDRLQDISCKTSNR